MNLTSLFSTPIFSEYYPNSSILNQKLTELFLDAEKHGDQYKNEVKRDTQGAMVFESKFDLFTWNNPYTNELAQFCHRCLVGALRQVTDYSLETFNTLEIQYHSWFHITRKGGFQGMHNHPNASWSGIYCIDPGDKPDTGQVRFHDPRSNASYYRDAGNEKLKMPYHTGGHQIQHEPGKIVMFPSYLMHEIFPYFGERPRIIVAFNCWVSSKT